MQGPEVVVIGSLNMDFIFHAPRIPAGGETLLGAQFATACGGKGANQALALAKLGREVAMVGRVGEDLFGETLVEGLKAHGVNISQIQKDPQAASGVALILLEENGQNRIIVASGANQRLQAQDLDSIETLLADAKVLLMQLEIPLETVTRATQIAKDLGIQVVLNPAPKRPLPRELLRQVDILIPNEVEAAMLVGASVGTDPKEIGEQLLREGSKMVVITLGSAGALVMSDKGILQIPAFEVEVVDTTAAGDAFIAGFIAGMLEGQHLPEAIRWGNAAGALACTRFGAQPSLPTREQVLHLLGL